MRGRLVEDRIEERICKIRVLDGVIANYYPQEELIRCKDCKYYLKSNEQCQLIITRLHFYETGNRWAEDSFCAWAERRTDEAD